jgi:hypothetical protein
MDMEPEVQEGQVDLHVFANGHQLNDEEGEEDWAEDGVVSRAKREVGDFEWETVNEDNALGE